MIFKRQDRTKPFTEGETEVSKKLLNLYYSFASKNEIIFGDVKEEAVNSKNIKGLEINEAGEGVIVELDDSFGTGPFWDDLEKTLTTEEKTYHDEF